MITTNLTFEKTNKIINLLHIIGGSVSLILYVILLCHPTPWTIPKTICSLIPFITAIILSFAIKYMFKPSINCSVKKGILLLSTFLLLICLNVVAFKVKRFDYIHVNLLELNKIDKEKQLSNCNEDYYVLFGSRNCTYCIQMEETYQEVFLKCKMENVYYVDLSYENTNSKLIMKRKINQLPILIKYNQGKELDRIVGVTKLSDLLSFIG